MVSQAIRDDASMTLPLALILGLLGAGVALSAFLILGKAVSTWPARPAMRGGRDANRLTLCVFIVTLLLPLLMFKVSPVVNCIDTIGQYYQAETGEYNDWHPVLHTLLYFGIPVLAGHGIGLATCLQILYFSLAFTYLIRVLYEEGCPRLLIALTLAYVLANPIALYFLIHPWKDVAFATFAAVLMAYYIRILSSKGQWLESKANALLFSIIAVACAYMRHNAILLVAPLVAIVLLRMSSSRKARAWVLSSILALFIAVEALYCSMGITVPPRRTVETVGLPMTVLCNVMKERPEALPLETRQLMYSFAAPEAYENDYTAGEFNAIKAAETIDLDKADEMTRGDALRYLWQCLRYAPRESVDALAKLTCQVWGFADLSESVRGLLSDRPGFFPMLYKIIRGVFSYGLVIWIMLAVGLLLLSRGRSSIIHALPLLCYDFGTMLLLSGSDARFFFPTFPLWAPVVYVMLRDATDFKGGRETL